MPYTTSDAIKTLNNYLGITDAYKQIIENTKKRGFVLRLDDGQEVVIFLYPIVHQQVGTKNFFDTRDSGLKERRIAWKYSLEHGMKYFCLGVNSEFERYRDYIFSLECDDDTIETICGTKNGVKIGSGNQIVIPNDFIPQKRYEKVKTRAGVYIAAVHKNSLRGYLMMFDNRPYLDKDDVMNNVETVTYESEFSRNRIIFGAPGTGKSYNLNRDKAALLAGGNEANYERVTFHPDYSYAHFVGTYKPVPCKDSEGRDAITYEYVPGPFMRIYKDALKSWENDENPRPFLLVIEEINRANVAAVFGDVFQLLDRDDNGISEYPVQASEDIKKYLAKQTDNEEYEPEQDGKYRELRIPGNMYIWATMNSADQGVFPMDTAFKRRWDFTYVGIDESEQDLLGKTVILGGEKKHKVEWNTLRKSINDFLAKKGINEDKQLGPYFLSKKIVVPEGDDIDPKNFIEAFKNKVLMYLFEDAAKQIRAAVFADGLTRYSEICTKFDTEGVRVFCSDIVKNAKIKDLPADSSQTGGTNADGTAARQETIVPDGGSPA